jgi:hypothetical protein
MIYKIFENGKTRHFGLILILVVLFFNSYDSCPQLRLDICHHPQVNTVEKSNVLQRVYSLFDVFFFLDQIVGTLDQEKQTEQE